MSCLHQIPTFLARRGKPSAQSITQTKIECSTMSVRERKITMSHNKLIDGVLQKMGHRPEFITSDERAATIPDGR